ncbi:hypothetical protein LCGC14_2609570, partial [marine sediment metagenome]
VESVVGKIGRAESALDPAPAAMIETYVMLKPRDAWREGMTEEKIWDEINKVATLLGVTPASPLQPIEGRVVMLQSGIKAPMAIRIYGDTLEGLGEASLAVGEHMKTLHEVNAGTVNPDIVMGKPYFEFEVDREEAARYGMTTMMVNQIVSAGLGGLDVTTTVEGRERYPIQIRYLRDVRERIDELRQIPVVTHTGNVVPLERLAQVTTTWGPGAINSEDARLVAHVSFSPSGAAGDLETVEAVMTSLRSARENGDLKFPLGNFEMQAVGSFQNQIEANLRLMWIVPTVILINLLLIQRVVELEKLLPNEWAKIKGFFERLKTNGPVVACYEAGCLGFELQKKLMSIEVPCMVVAPGLVPRRPSERIRTDRRDARKLALHLRSGEVTSIHIPTQKDEAARDYLRMLDDFKMELKKTRQRLLHFLLRHNIVYTDGTHWTGKHERWLRSLSFEDPLLKATFDEYF